MNPQNMDRRFLIASLSAAMGATAAGQAFAQAHKNNTVGALINPPSFNAADKARIDKGTRYLQNLATAQGRFEQTDARGRKIQGNWYLSRPGKMRFEYDAPNSTLMVSDGKTVSKWDPRLQTFDRYPLDQTPLALFLAHHIRFDRNVVITEVTGNSTGFTLKARDRRRNVEGFVVLKFNQNPQGAVTLSEWTIVDAQGRPTTVRLMGLKTGVALKPNLFTLSDPRKG